MIHQQLRGVHGTVGRDFQTRLARHDKQTNRRRHSATDTVYIFMCLCAQQAKASKWLITYYVLGRTAANDTASARAVTITRGQAS